METEDTSSKLHEPSIECIDCSYGYEDAQNLIDDLREIAWRAYFIGVIGDTDCYSCSPDDPSLTEISTPMSLECRRCHYPIEDLLNSDHVDCARNEPLRCASLDRGVYNLSLIHI